MIKIPIQTRWRPFQYRELEDFFWDRDEFDSRGEVSFEVEHQGGENDILGEGCGKAPTPRTGSTCTLVLVESSVSTKSL